MGRAGGRARKLADPKQPARVGALDGGGQADVATICASLGVLRATFYPALKERGAP